MQRMLLSFLEALMLANVGPNILEVVLECGEFVVNSIGGYLNMRNFSYYGTRSGGREAQKFSGIPENSLKRPPKMAP